MGETTAFASRVMFYPYVSLVMFLLYVSFKFIWYDIHKYEFKNSL